MSIRAASRHPRTRVALSAAALLPLLVGVLSAVPSATAAAASLASAPVVAARGNGASEVVNACLRSVPQPGSKTRVKICYTLFKPKGASAERQVPMIMHSHGFGGSRTRNAADFSELLRSRYGVLSFDQRGFGQSGGTAFVQNPRLEGHDVRRLIRLISRLPWVAKDRPGDPRLGAVGGSYGGGYQFLGAFEELRRKGRPVFDALAPEITWNDLEDSLAPEGVVRTEWALALSAASLPSQALPTFVYKALVEGAVTGEFPDGSLPGGEDLVSFFAKNGPAFHIEQGRRLDIPVLFGQGLTDSLFPMRQAFTNWRQAITPQARRDSIFVGYNGGHVLPALLPRGVNVTSDPCSRRLAGGDFRRLAVRFFDEQIKGRDRNLGGYGRMHLATPESRCTTISSPAANRKFEVGRVATTQAVGVPLAYEVARGPIRVAGAPYLTGKVTALGLQNRAFYGLAVGTNPLNARLVQNNVLPINEPLPVTGAPRRVDLPGVAVDVPRGQKLFLLASAISDTFLAMGSRVPGAMLIEDTIVHLPVVRR